MNDVDGLIARREHDVAIPPFDALQARRRARRGAPLAPFVIAAAVALVVAGAGIGPLRERLATPGAAASMMPISLPAGQVLASPDGQRIAVIGAASVTVHDTGGRELQRWAIATPYANAKWLSDGSGLLVDTGTSLVVLESDGRTTRLQLATPPALPGYTWLAPDGRTFASDTTTAVLVLDRDGSTPQTVITGADHHLLGFDAESRVLVIDGADARALGAGGYTIPLPAIGNPLYEAGTGASPDGAVVLVAMATPVDQLIAISGRSARAIPRPVGWVGPHAFVARAGPGGIELWDAATGDHHVISAIPNSATLHGTSGTAVLWTAVGVTHVTDTATGADRIVPPLAVSAKAQPLVGGRFLVVDGLDREVLAPE
ncbi:MAG TPA: hypothetical protein VF001_08925 [Candidatus Limnocylindria bacterium]